MSHAFLEILAERRKNITEKVWFTNHACFMEILVRNWINGDAWTYNYYIKVKTERSSIRFKKNRNKQFINKKKRTTGQWKKTEKKEKKKRNLNTALKKKKKKEHFFKKIDSA